MCTKYINNFNDSHFSSELKGEDHCTDEPCDLKTPSSGPEAKHHTEQIRSLFGRTCVRAMKEPHSLESFYCGSRRLTGQEPSSPAAGWKILAELKFSDPFEKKKPFFNSACVGVSAECLVRWLVDSMWPDARSDVWSVVFGDKSHLLSMSRHAVDLDPQSSGNGAEVEKNPDFSFRRDLSSVDKTTRMAPECTAVPSQVASACRLSGKAKCEKAENR